MLEVGKTKCAICCRTMSDEVLRRNGYVEWEAADGHDCGEFSPPLVFHAHYDCWDNKMKEHHNAEQEQRDQDEFCVEGWE